MKLKKKQGSRDRRAFAEKGQGWEELIRSAFKTPIGRMTQKIVIFR